jgi:DNA repair exonuclease SbcCD ATPase subunit
MIPIRVVFKNNDDKLLKIDELIEAKRQMLRDKEKTIGKIAKQNKFLEDVKNDYSNYNNIITKQKHEQIQALELIHKYINDLKSTEQISKQNIEDAKNDQSKIMNEIQSIKQNLEGIVNS